MYTVTDITELVQHHLVRSTDNDDVDLAQLINNIERMMRRHRITTSTGSAAMSAAPPTAGS